MIFKVCSPPSTAGFPVIGFKPAFSRAWLGAGEGGAASEAVIYPRPLLAGFLDFFHVSSQTLLPELVPGGPG